MPYLVNYCTRRVLHIHFYFCYPEVSLPLVDEFREFNIAINLKVDREQYSLQYFKRAPIVWNDFRGIVSKYSNVEE